ncbi:hypothetical protein SteCoe_19369 [Stentor coeruleus]|uniref:Cytochrome b5 heme-binding domain-containing protein n=1 Tax=Stentor coeruleus TaxID=5963 RepID=A0A1R2BUE5_9CILI|nr:hypothetical protein SteCoe_19369 [Stentor coeruleus]
MNSLFLFLPLILISSSTETITQNINSVMTMSWTIEDSTWIQIRLQCKIKLGYCSIGLSSTMTNCDMFAAITDGKFVTLTDYWATSHDTPKSDKIEGGNEDLVYNYGGVDSLGYIDITFKRKLSTGDSFDQVINPDIRGDICWGYRNNRAGWTEHSDYGSAGFVWATTSANAFFKASNGSKEDHGIAMSVAWGALAVVGIFVCRYFKYTAWWFYIHMSFLLTASLITIISSSQLYKDDAYSVENIEDDTNVHSRLGMLMSSLVIGECVFGFLTSYFKIFTENVQVMTLITRAHKIVGYTLLICGLINCWKGWVLYGDNTGKSLMIFCFALTGAIFMLFEAYQIFVRNGRRNPLALKISCTENEVPGKYKKMSHMKAIALVRKGKKLMFYDDLVIDVGHFYLSHPGGSFMISKCYGEDVGKYMVGCSSYGGNLLPYTHSLKAFSYLSNLAIGRIKYPKNYIIPITEKPQNLMIFQLVFEKPLNDHTFLAYFKSDDFKMANSCSNLLWIGKHFMVCYKTKFHEIIRRYYSSIFVDINKWAYELGILDNFQKTEDGLVKIIFKVYPGGKMTNYLNNLNAGDKIIFKGPLGPGLQLKSLEGNYLAFAGGTGLVPFLDLVYIAWKNLPDGNDFFLTLFVSFKTRKDGFALNILEEMQEVGGKWLKVYIITDESKDKEFLSDIIVETMKKEVSGAWICGPSGYNRYYTDFLVKNGLEKRKIIVM